MKKKKIIPVVLGFIIVLAVAGVMLLKLNGAPGKPGPSQLKNSTQSTAAQLQTQLTIQGEKALTVEYGTQFQDPGAVAVLKILQTGTEKAISVTVKGTVDVNKVGTYQLEYTASAEGGTCTDYRTVTVADTQCPVISLVSDPNKYTLPGQAYAEEGFTATDNHDGDITAQVQRLEENGKVTYTVKDSFGNTASIVRDIVYNDPIAPQITLQGDSYIILSYGGTFEEPGFTAADNCDGDLTASVQVSGLPDPQKSGTYTVTYQVADKYNNVTTASRTVYVKEKGVDLVNDPSKGTKFIYLTFDDGPGPYTEELLDILAKYNVKVTFFVVNTPFVNLVKREAEEGHTVAIHTATHKFGEIYANEDAYFKDLYKMQEIIKQYTGKISTFLRFPGGSSNTISSSNKGLMTRLTKLVGEKGFKYFDWNVDSMDAGGAKTAKKVFENVKKSVDGNTNSVVLMHDIKDYTVEAIEDIIIWGLENGYTFLPVSENSPTCHHKVNN